MIRLLSCLPHLSDAVVFRSALLFWLVVALLD